MKYILLSLVLLLQQHVVLHAQDFFAKWDSIPVMPATDTQFKAESAVFLKDYRQHHFAFQGENLALFTTMHRAIRVLDEKGVVMYNKIYIPLHPDAEVKEIRARVIKPNGQVVNLPADKILEVEEDGSRFKKFALEGVETGSVIEYIAQYVKQLSLFGLEVFQFSNSAVQDAKFTLLTPAHLYFSVKGYNGMNEVKDTVIGETRHVEFASTNVPAIFEEKYGEAAPHIQHVQYKFSYNLNQDRENRLYTWDNVAAIAYEKYNKFTEKERKALSSFVKQLDIRDDGSEEEKIIALEHALKTRVSINEEGISESADQVENIIKTKVASHEGFIKLFSGCMQALDIRFELVYVNTRSGIQIDEELENYRLIEELIFYFPGTKKFLQPTNVGMRYPLINPYWAGTNGLFVKPMISGSSASAYGRFESIPILPYTSNLHNMDIKVKLNKELDSVHLRTQQYFAGYTAGTYRPAWSFLPPEKLKEFQEEIVKNGAAGSQVRGAIETKNTSMLDGVKNKPLIVEGEVTTADLLEKAGNNLLLKIGLVIGPQVEMYQEKPRQRPVNMEFPHTLDRTIEMVIPEGYVIKNPDDLNMRVPDSGTGLDMGFESSYSIEGNILKVKLHEYYKSHTYPMDRFATFKDVINAAADFNKVVLVLQKKA